MLLYFKDQANGEPLIQSEYPQNLSIHCKKVYRFSHPQMSLTKLSHREQLNCSPPERVWLLTSRLETGKEVTFFTVYIPLGCLFFMSVNVPVLIYSKFCFSGSFGGAEPFLVPAGITEAQKGHTHPDMPLHPAKGHLHEL